jgi:hypothetical protein
MLTLILQVEVSKPAKTSNGASADVQSGSRLPVRFL